MGANLIEELARIPADAEARMSEFRYRSPVVDPDTLASVAVSAVRRNERHAPWPSRQRKGGQVMGAVNVVGSAIGRECGHGIFLHARAREVAVASTKALTNMVVNFALLGLLLGRVQGPSAPPSAGVSSTACGTSRPQVTSILNAEEEIATVAHRYAEADHMFFIGRVSGWPVAREGAQKLKEISYVRAEWPTRPASASTARSRSSSRTCQAW